jgi:GNAT superfamily N-acetyltransferase
VTDDGGQQVELTRFLRAWLGSWPPELPLDVVGSSARTRPGWDGRHHPAIGVWEPGAGCVLSVPPAAVEPLELLGGLDADVLTGDAWGQAAANALGRPDHRFELGVFRWLADPRQVADVAPLGRWVPRDDPDLPSWLRPFDAPEVLVHRDRSGRHLAGVGVKVHDTTGVELAVVTETGVRGQGFGRRLVATAARRWLSAGCVVTYLHDPSDAPSAALADAVGFRDRGWRVVWFVAPEG